MMIFLFHRRSRAFETDIEYDKAGVMLVTFGNSAVALCEYSNRIFPNHEEWDKKHEEIYQTTVFQKDYEKAIKLAQNNESFRRFLIRHSDQDPEEGKGLG